MRTIGGYRPKEMIMMQGLELSRRYFEACLPLLQEQAGDILPLCAVGLAGRARNAWASTMPRHGITIGGRAFASGFRGKIWPGTGSGWKTSCACCPGPSRAFPAV